MTKLNRNIMVLLALGICIAGLSGCKKEGPLEKTGKSIDKAAEKTGEKIDEVGKKIKDSTRK